MPRARGPPLGRLAAFARTDVPAGASAAIRLSIPYERLAVRINGAWVVERATYEIAVGRHAHDPAAAIARIGLPERTLKK